MPIINSVIKGGSAPVIDTLNVTPTTSAQQITAPQGTDGYSPVNVSAVTSSIDANIIAGNIKDGVTILGVTGDYTGTTPSGTKQITSNGTHDVSGYANADVQVPTTAPAHYIEKAVDANNKLINSSNMINFNGVTDIGDYVLANTYHNVSFPNNTSVDLSNLTTISGRNSCDSMFHTCTGIISVDLSSLTTISGSLCCGSMFQSCSNLISVDLSSLTTISSQSCGNMFYNCLSLTSVDLSSLTTISGTQATSAMFYGCNALTSIDLSSLTTVNGSAISCTNMFSDCRNLTSVDLSSLTDISGPTCFQTMFQNCTSLATLSFPSLTSTSFGNATNQFYRMLRYVTGCTVHFPSNLQSVIGSWSDVTAGFAGTNTTVLFDLPATNTLTGADTEEYRRNPKYDTATALSWYRVGTDRFTTQYYTSGTTDPQVNDTIYSDSACTTSVTTISSIA